MIDSLNFSLVLNCSVDTRLIDVARELTRLGMSLKDAHKVIDKVCSEPMFVEVQESLWKEIGPEPLANLGVYATPVLYYAIESEFQPLPDAKQFPNQGNLWLVRTCFPLEIGREIDYYVVKTFFGRL